MTDVVKTGDYVTGVPSSARMREEQPTITGRLEVTAVEFLDESWNLYQVHAQYDDGTDLPIDVLEDSIRLASQRRTPVTVFPIAGLDLEEDDGDQ